MTFNRKFGLYVCDGDIITTEQDGFKITARIEHDEYAGMPWSREDGHGPVSDWTRRAKRPGERILCQDRQSYRYYDFEEAVKIAKRDGWGPGTPAEAAEHDFKVLKAWCNDEWRYVGVVLSVSKNGVSVNEHAASLWGIEANYPDSDNSYLTDVANELLGEALEVAKNSLKNMVGKLTA